MKKETKIEQIYARFLRNEATAFEINHLFNYFEAGDDTDVRELIAQNFNSVLSNEIHDLERELHLTELQIKINLRIDTAQVNENEIKSRPTLFSQFKSARYQIAASFLLVTLLSFFIYSYLSVDDIRPGGNYATLLTANGKKIDLSAKANTEIEKAHGVTIYKTANGQIIYTALPNQPLTPSIWNSITTPRGGKYKITLSDGTLVVLNSDSKLEFPVGFRGAERCVKLIGEAYFEVVKNKSKPFIVISGESKTEVLGTKFSISNYPEDRMIKTTLLEGKVKFTNSVTQAFEILSPGQQSILKDQQLQVSNVNAEDYIAWKDNRFVFNNEELAVIMRQLSRWYDVEINYATLPDRRLYVNISRDLSLMEVLNQFALTSNLNFKLEGRRLYVVN